MSGLESIVVLGLVVLLVIGIALMFAPLSSGEDAPGLVLREIEPQVGEEGQLIDFRYSITQIQSSPDSDTETEAPKSDDEVLLPMENSDEDLALEESMTRIDDELFYLVATDEVDSDHRQPALWAKVIALNSGDEQRARFHYIRLRAAQMLKNQPTASAQETHGEVMEVTEIVPPVGAESASDAGADGPVDVPKIEVVSEPEAEHVAASSDDASLGGLVGPRPFSKAQIRPEPEPLAKPECAPVAEPDAVAEQAVMAEQASMADVQARAAGRMVVEAEMEAAMKAFPDPAPVPGWTPVTETQSPPKAKMMAEEQPAPKVNRSIRAKRAPIEGAFGPILNRTLVMQVIDEGRLIGRLIRSADLLRDFSVARYVTSDEIRRARAGKVDSWPEASAYFDNYQHRTAVNLGDSLQRFDKSIVRSYLLARQFPHQLWVDFFDEALVITILPGSPQMEFLVLVPGGGLGDPLSAKFLASSRITELFMAAASGDQNPLTLYVELDLLLERLRIG